MTYKKANEKERKRMKFDELFVFNVMSWLIVVVTGMWLIFLLYVIAFILL